MFAESGESYDAKTDDSNCPSESRCAMFALAASENDGDGLEACKGCALLPTKPQNLESDAGAEVESLVEEIADIIFWEDAGSATDWAHYSFETRQLFGIWREAEKQVNRIQQARMQMFIKSFAGAK